MDILWDLEVFLKPKAQRVSHFSVCGDMDIYGTFHHSLIYMGRSLRT